MLRESLDPDDFRGGFAIGSRTFVSAPLVAGLLAESLVGPLAGGSPSVEERIKLLQQAAKEIAALFALPADE